MAGITLSSSWASVTSGPGPAFTPPISSRSAPSSTSAAARRTRSSKAKVAPLSKNESGVRLRIPITSARLLMSNFWSPKVRVAACTNVTLPSARGPRSASEEAGGQCLAVTSGPGVVRTERLQEIEKLLPGIGVILDPVEQPGKEIIDPLTGNLHLLGCQAGLRQQAASLGSLRYPAEQGDRLVGGTPGGEQPGQGADGISMIGLELERLSK